MHFSPLTLKMAAQGAWSCQLCIGSYVHLRDLVSHVRASHSSEEYICGVHGCPRSFRKTNTWYKHIIDSHYAEYQMYQEASSDHSDQEASSDHSDQEASSDHSDHSNSDRSDHSEDQGDSGDSEGQGNWEDGHMDDLETESSAQVSSSPSVFISEDEIAGKYLMIKEHHRLSQAAVDDIVQLVKTVHNDVCTRALYAVRHCGEDFGMDMSSIFFQELSEIFQQLKSPIASIETAYKQQSYITNNLPYYVVCTCMYVLHAFYNYNFVDTSLARIRNTCWHCGT